MTISVNSFKLDQSRYPSPSLDTLLLSDCLFKAFKDFNTETLTLHSSLKTCCRLPPPEHMPTKRSPRVRLSSKTTWQEQASSSSDNLYNTVVVSARLRALSFTIPGPNSQSTLQTNFLELSLRQHHCLLVTQPLPGSCLSPHSLSTSSDTQPPESCPTLSPNFSGRRRRYLFSMAKSSLVANSSLPQLSS